MRALTVLLTLAVLAFAVRTFALGDEEAAPDLSPKVAALEKKVSVLEKQVEYLLSRDKTMTAYVLEHEGQGRALVGAVGLARTQGFTQRAIPAESRETLLGGLSALGQGLQKDVPVVTKEEKALLDAADRASK